MVWAEVASKNTTFKISNVRALLMEAIANVTANTWRNCIDHVIKVASRMWDLDGLMNYILEPFIIHVGDSDSLIQFVSSFDSSDSESH